MKVSKSIGAIIFPVSDIFSQTVHGVIINLTFNLLSNPSRISNDSEVIPRPKYNPDDYDQVRQWQHCSGRPRSSCPLVTKCLRESKRGDLGK